MEQVVPVEKNKYYEMQIESLGHDGEGIGRINQFAVFVPNALPGDKINVKIVKLKKSYAYGKLIDIFSLSPHRVEPLCPIHGKCGGCQLQHLAYSEQLKFKKQKVIDNLERIGGLKGLEVYDTLGMENPFRYRNKVQLPVGLSKEGRIQIGFYAPRSHNIIEMETCAIQPEVNDELIKHIKKWMVGYNISPYDENTGTGLIRHIFTRIGFKTGEIMLVLITNGRKIPYVDQLVDGIKQVNPNVTSIIQNINSQKTNVIMGKENKLLHGADYITDYIGEVKFKISPM